MHAVMTLMTDVLVIGSGMAGCRAAIAAADKGSDVILATKKTLGGGASTYPVAEMAGYNAGDRTKINDIEGHYRDMVVAGQGMANPILARILAEHAPDTISELEKWGVVFEKENGHYYVFQSCFASAPRTHVVRGHGVPIVNAMIRQIKLRQNIKIVEDVVIAELSVHKEQTAELKERLLQTERDVSRQSYTEETVCRLKDLEGRMDELTDPYTITVTNSGNTTLTDVVVTDTLTNAVWTTT